MSQGNVEVAKRVIDAFNRRPSCLLLHGPPPAVLDDVFRDGATLIEHRVAGARHRANDWRVARRLPQPSFPRARKRRRNLGMRRARTLFRGSSDEGSRIRRCARPGARTRGCRPRKVVAVVTLGEGEPSQRVAVTAGAGRRFDVLASPTRPDHPQRMNPTPAGSSCVRRRQGK
jgi:hypothetical protein